MKLKPVQRDGAICGYTFWCPGCKETHYYYTELPKGWNFNGDMDRPTFSPSLLRYATANMPRCHLFVTDGQIIFCGDSEHEYAGKTIPMVEIPGREE